MSAVVHLYKGIVSDDRLFRAANKAVTFRMVCGLETTEPVWEGANDAPTCKACFAAKSVEIMQSNGEVPRDRDAYDDRPFNERISRKQPWA